MQVDAVFSCAKVYNIDKKIEVNHGQKFSLLTDLTGEARWFSDNDQVLNITADGNKAVIEAAGVGKSTILLIFGKDYGIEKELEITVMAPADQAASLGVRTGKPVNK